MIKKSNREYVLAILIVIPILMVVGNSVYQRWRSSSMRAESLVAEERVLREQASRIASMNASEKQMFVRRAICAEGRQANSRGESYLLGVESKTRALVQAKGENFASPKWQKSITEFRTTVASNCPDVW